MDNQTIYLESRLMKSRLLVHESGIFPGLVEAAAWAKRRPYTPDLLRHVASDENILDAIHHPINEGMDATLTALLNEHGAEVDLAVLNAVASYEVPQAPPTDPQDS